MSTWWLTIAAFCFGTVYSITVPNQKCRTSKNEPFGKNEELCVFPFIYNDKTYHSCTYDDADVGDDGFKPWCSIQTDEDGVHVSSDDGSTYGICDDFDKCPIPPQYCGTPNVVHKDIKGGESEDVTIEQQPWMVSLGRYVGLTTWKQECGGSLITNKHVLTAAHCFDNIKDSEKQLKGYTMRLGITDFELESKHDGVERFVIDVMTHPKYQQPALYFDIGIAVADRIIEFTQTILPICLPFRPIDDTDHLKGKFVNLAGWGTKDASDQWATTNLRIYNLKVFSKDECNKSMSIENNEKSGIPNNIRLRRLPNDLTKELACIDDTLLVENSKGSNRNTGPYCQDHSGSPVVAPVPGASKRTSFEQHFVLSWRPDCNNPTMISTRISNRQILNWIQNVTGTWPSLMVVAGDTDRAYLEEGHAALTTVELLSTTKTDDYCRIPVNDVIGETLQEDKVDEVTGQRRNTSEGELSGLTGYFANNAAIVCGGTNIFHASQVCFELDAKTKSWNKIPDMNYRRNNAAASTDNSGNLWIIGGYDNCNKSDSSEIYEYKQNGQGSWKTGVALPSELHESSIKDHCVVRINSTHLFMVGGTAQLFSLPNDFDDAAPTTFTSCPTDNSSVTFFNESDTGGGIYFKNGWIYDGNAWKPTSDMSVARGKPACSLVEMDDGEVGILVTSGCDGFCLAPKPYTPEVHRSTEVYNLQTGEWSLRKAKLPNQLNIGRLDIFEGLPTFVGGFNEDDQKASEKIYQYHWDQDEWILYPDLTLTYPRHNFALFQVPKNLFGFC